MGSTRTSRVDVTLLCRNCGRTVRRAPGAPVHMDRGGYSYVLCRDSEGRPLNPASHAELTRWKVARLG